MITRRHFLAGLAAAAVAAGTGTLAGCSGGDTDDAAVDLDGKRVGAVDDYAFGKQFTATKPLTFTLLYNDHPNYPYKKNWMLWEEIAKRTNVTFQPTIVPLSDFEQKRSLMIGAGDAPEIMAKSYPGNEVPFVSSGAILPVSAYVDLMPHYTQRVKEWKLESNIESLRQKDGQYYVLPGLHEAPWPDYTIAMRTDVLKDLGLAAPATWDDFRDVLRAIKKEHPDRYPLSDRFQGNNLLAIISQTYGTKAGWGWGAGQWDAAAKKFVFTGTSPQYKDFVTYLRSLTDEKLLDPESFVQDDDSATAKFVTGKSFAISTNAQSLASEYRDPLAQNIKGATVSKITVPAGPIGSVVSGSQLENGLMISSKAAEREDFVAMMQFVDWLWYSPAGQEFAKWGVDGVTYTKQGDKFTLEKGIGFLDLNPGAPKDLREDFGFSGGNFAYGGTTALLQSTFSEEELVFQAEMAKKEKLPLDPPAPLDDTDQEQATLLSTPLKDYVSQQTLKFILGERDLSEWDAYVKEVEGKGSQKYIDLINTAQQEYAEAHG